MIGTTTRMKTTAAATSALTPIASVNVAPMQNLGGCYVDAGELTGRSQPNPLSRPREVGALLSAASPPVRFGRGYREEKGRALYESMGHAPGHGDRRQHWIRR
jgi:hypothetical protein